MAEQRGGRSVAVSGDLRALQSAFQDYLTSGDPRILELVISDAAASGKTRLDVYANAYRLRLLEALGTDYPGLHALLGDAQFEALGRAYIDAHPSAHPSLRWFGAALPVFTADTAPYSEQPLIAELARFEWAQAEVFDAADARPVALAALQAVAAEDWPLLRGALHPSVLQLELHWNVPPIWQALDAGQTPPEPLAAELPQTWLMWRRELETHWRSLEVDEAWALQGFGRGEVFADICEGLSEWIDVQHIALRAAGFLKSWIHDQLIIELTVSPDP